MTETLTRALHDQADSVLLEPVDLDAVTRQGARAVRRRGWGIVAGGAALVAVSAGLVAAPWRDAPTPTPIAPAPATTSPTWASGSVLHTAAGDVDLGVPFYAYVRTARGYVVTDYRTIWSWMDGQLRQVGTVEGSFPSSTFRMVGDTDGSLVAWPSRHGPIVLDQEARTVTRIPEVTQVQVLSVDDRSVYLLGAEGHAIAVDVDTQRVTPVDKFNNEADGNDASLVDAQDGTYLGYDLKGDAVANTAADQWVTLGFDQHSALTLSPDGRWAVVGDDMTPSAVSAYDLREASRAVLPTDSYLAYPYEWLDDDTVVLLSLATEDAHYRLLTCTVSEPSCRVAVPDLGEGKDSGPGNGVGFVLPIGESYFPYLHG
jgi:hypothetical protein